MEVKMAAETRMNGSEIEKKCSSCNEFKPLTEFAFKANGLYNTRSWCKACELVKNTQYQKKRYAEDPEFRNTKNQRTRNYYETNKEKHITSGRLYVLRTKYNLTAEEFNELAAGGCESCGSYERLCVDHDHITNKVRGILCHKCNSALGLLDEDANKILRLASYLENKYAMAKCDEKVEKRDTE